MQAFPSYSGNRDETSSLGHESESSKSASHGGVLNRTKNSNVKLPQHQPKIQNDMEKLYKLLTGKHSQDLTTRHEHALSKVFQRRSNGFIVEDLAHLNEIISYLHNLVKQDCDGVYTPHLVKYIETLAKPININGISDHKGILSAERILSEMVESIVALLSSPSVRVLAAAIYTLDHLIAQYMKIQRDRVQTTCLARAWQDTEIRVVEQCRIPTNLGHALDLILQDERSGGLSKDTRARLLSLIWGCTCIDQLLQLFVEENLPERLCSLLGSDLSYFSSPNGLLIVEALWQCIDSTHTEAVVEQLNSAKCTQAVTDALRQTFQQGTTKSLKQARNDLIALVGLLTRHPKLRDQLVVR